MNHTSSERVCSHTDTLAHSLIFCHTFIINLYLRACVCLQSQYVLTKHRNSLPLSLYLSSFVLIPSKYIESDTQRIPSLYVHIFPTFAKWFRVNEMLSNGVLSGPLNSHAKCELKPNSIKYKWTTIYLEHTYYMRTYTHTCTKHYMQSIEPLQDRHKVIIEFRYYFRCCFYCCCWCCCCCCCYSRMHFLCATIAWLIISFILNDYRPFILLYT